MKLCRYCGTQRAIHFDHIVSKADRRRYEGDWETEKVISCGPCNWRKSTRKLVPFSYPRLKELQEIDKHWREWDGDVTSDAFRNVHK